MGTLESVFLTVCNMSITAAFIIIFTVIVRFCIRKEPKSLSYLLWSAAGFRLLCPYSFSSVFSLLNIGLLRGHSVNSGITQWNLPVPGEGRSVGQQIPTPNTAEAITDAAPQMSNENGILELLTVLWLLGLAIFLVYEIVVYWKLKKRVEQSVKYDKNIYECDKISQPFVMGILKPGIYLPFRLSQKEKEYIIFHEQCHLKRRDYLVKFAATILLAIHWFNPFVWVAYHLMSADMEMSCDEAVVRKLGYDVKEEYSHLLIRFAAEKNRPIVSPLAFGESSIKERIKNILSFQMPKTPVVVLTVIICAAAVLFGMGNAGQQDLKWCEKSIQKYNEQKIKAVHRYDLVNGKIDNNSDFNYVADENKKRLKVQWNGGDMESILCVENGKGYSYGRGVNSPWSKSTTEVKAVEDAIKTCSIIVGNVKKYSLAGEEKINGRKTIKIRVEERKGETLTASIKELNPDEVNEAIKHSENFRKAYQDSLNQGPREFYIWFDAKTRKPIKSEVDCTKDRTLLYYLKEESGVGFGDRAPEKVVLVKFYSEQELEEEIKIPAEYEDYTNAGD